MTDPRLKMFPELLARPVEAKADTPRAGAEIIRQAKKEAEWWSVFEKSQ